MSNVEVVITGIGTLSPLGIGREEVEAAMRGGRSGVGPITLFDPAGLPVRIAGEVKGFDAKRFVKPRKSLKVMSRDSQLGVAASVLACEDAGIEEGSVAPERFGVVLGADTIGSTLDSSEGPYRACIVEGAFKHERWAVEGAAKSFPLDFLKVLPNMIASHISIAHDARGPNNTMHHGELSSLLALCEAASVIERGAADVMLAGGASSQMNPFDWVRHCLIGGLSPSTEPPERVLRPFDSGRSGQVRSEGATVFVVESLEHAVARGAESIARVAGWSTVFESGRRNDGPGRSMVRAMSGAISNAGMAPTDMGHVNAGGLSTPFDDPIEAAAIHAVVDDTPVIAPKSYFGNLGAAAGATELHASLIALNEGVLLPTLNYERPDPQCPVNVVCEASRDITRRNAVALNATRHGQTTALVLARPA